MSILLFAAITADCSSGGSENLKVYAVKYGESLFPKRFIFFGDKSSDKLPFSWLFYYIEYRDKKILVDTGFNSDKLSKMFEISGFTDPVEILKENGIQPEAITDIIITHSHFDHIGNADRFSKARIIINKNEFDSFMKGRGLDTVRLFMKNNPRVHTFNESISLYEFFRIKRVGGHSEGSSVVFFSSGGKEYCLTGDEAYLDENISEVKGNGSIVNHEANLRFLNDLKLSGIKPFIFHDSRYYGDSRRFIRVLPQSE